MQSRDLISHRSVDRVMEHRWGTRFVTHLAVRLTAANGVEAVGWLLDISLSGTYVVTRTPLERGQHVVLRVEETRTSSTARSAPIRAFVARHAADGFGLEWAEFAPDAVHSLLTAITASRHRR
jgi:hypothetical protein